MKLDVIAASLFSAYLVYKIIENKNTTPEPSNYGYFLFYFALVALFIIPDIIDIEIKKEE